MPDSDEDRRLFEQALAELAGASPAKVARIKGGEGPSGATKAGRSQRPRRLDKLGKSAEPEAVVDLHGLDRRTAIRQVRAFLADNRSRELLLIVHGKGRGVLQTRITTFLESDANVAEHIQAPQRLGGAGARLVRLRRRG